MIPGLPAPAAVGTKPGTRARSTVSPRKEHAGQARAGASTIAKRDDRTQPLARWPIDKGQLGVRYVVENHKLPYDPLWANCVKFATRIFDGFVDCRPEALLMPRFLVRFMSNILVPRACRALSRMDALCTVRAPTKDESERIKVLATGGAPPDLKTFAALLKQVENDAAYGGAALLVSCPNAAKTKVDQWPCHAMVGVVVNVDAAMSTGYVATIGMYPASGNSGDGTCLALLTGAARNATHWEVLLDDPQVTACARPEGQFPRDLRVAVFAEASCGLVRSRLVALLKELTNRDEWQRSAVQA